MLTIKFILENKEYVVERLAVKNFDAKSIVEEIIHIEGYRKSTKQNLENSLSELNNYSKKIGIFYKEGKKDEAESIKLKSAELKEEIKILQNKSYEAEKHLTKTLIQLPNIPHISVPTGVGEKDNILIKSNVIIPKLDNNAIPHWEIAKKYDIIDFELGNKITGSGFPVYKNKGAKLQRALINFFLHEAQESGYIEFLPPLIVNEDSAYGTGQLPDKDGQMYHTVEDNFYLIPTSEVPLTNIYRDVILNASDFPIKNTAYTPCFRREAGSYGKDVRGLNRLHQFDKVEIICIQHPDKSYDTLEEMVNYIESLIKKLNLPYRIQKLCGGDISFTSALTYDFEVFSAAQKKWLEVSSVSNFESFQSNRLKLRFREEGEKRTKLAHTLNGSALALPRIVAALLENNQCSEGIRIPECLVEYTGFELIN
ncbi:MAG: serine--tRNA ligase [Bacteroidales bacterium]|nr:serine--tRNA ligase [Bacteroidales bacterium]